VKHFSAPGRAAWLSPAIGTASVEILPPGRRGELEATMSWNMIAGGCVAAALVCGWGMTRTLSSAPMPVAEAGLALAYEGGEGGAQRLAHDGGEGGAQRLAHDGGEGGAQRLAHDGGEGGAQRLAHDGGEGGANRISELRTNSSAVA
jgi:hypothetical protein